MVACVNFKSCNIGNIMRFLSGSNYSGADRRLEMHIRDRFNSFVSDIEVFAKANNFAGSGDNTNAGRSMEKLHEAIIDSDYSVNLELTTDGLENTSMMEKYRVYLRTSGSYGISPIIGHSNSIKLDELSGFVKNMESYKDLKKTLKTYGVKVDGKPEVFVKEDLLGGCDYNADFSARHNYKLTVNLKLKL